MIGLDTNVIVRYIVQDDRVQFDLATMMFDRLTSQKRGFISVVTIVETAWVLARAYDATNYEISEVIEGMLRVDHLHVESEQAVFAAMLRAKNDDASFADALIGELGVRAGCAYTLTFDRKASRFDTFELLV